MTRMTEMIPLICLYKNSELFLMISLRKPTR